MVYPGARGESDGPGLAKTPRSSKEVMETVDNDLNIFHGILKLMRKLNRGKCSDGL